MFKQLSPNINTVITTGGLGAGRPAGRQAMGSPGATRIAILVFSAAITILV